MAVAASVGDLDQVATWQPVLEDDLYMQGIYDRALTELFVPIEVDGRVVAAVFQCPNGPGLYPAWEGYDKDMSGVAVLVDLTILGGAVQRVV